MSKGLALTRTEKNQDLLIMFKDSTGETIEIRQNMKRVGNQIKVVIDAPKGVEILRGELVDVD